jgi:VWFA-related protein
MAQRLTSARIFSVIIIGCLGFGLLINIRGQESPGLPQESGRRVERPEKDFVIRVGVEEVRLDAVVVDKKGHQITDLTADDFEIYQDGQPQKITYSTYIAEHKPQAAQEGVSAHDSQKEQPVVTAPLSKEEVHRTILFLIDDLSMGMPNLANTRMALQKFVETQMLPGDLVAIMRTKGWDAGLQTFSSDKRDLLKRINNIRWDATSASYIYPLGIPQLFAVAYSIDALRDMPGRKYLMLISTQIMLPPGVSNDQAFNGIADAALRAGVVINTLDVLGVINSSTIMTTTEDRNTHQTFVGSGLLDAETRPYGDKENHEYDKMFGPTGGDILLAQANDRMTKRRIPLSEKTGGLFLTGYNFFINGIGAAEEEMKGYYLLSYIPPANTFRTGSPVSYHKVTIKVKRPGAEIHTRDGFYGVAGNPASTEIEKNPLLKAMFSPFRYGGLNLNLAAAYIDDPESGYILQAWLHLDGQHLDFVSEEYGGYSLSLDAVAATCDVDGIVRNSGNKHIGFRVSEKDIEYIRENGVKFSLSIPAEKPGAYYVRAAAKDNASGAIGSSYEYVEIPDLKKGTLSLSNLFMLNGNEDAAWIQAGMKDDSQGPAPSSQKKEKRNQALRTYVMGETLEYMAIVYNAKFQEGHKPDLQSQIELYGNGELVKTGRLEPVDVGGIKDYKRIAIRKKLKLDLYPGKYVLQVRITDKQMKGKNSFAVQGLYFDIVPSKSSTLAAKKSEPPEVPAAEKKTVVEMTAKELVRAYHDELSSVEFSQSQEPLNVLLKRAGDNVISFFHDLPNISAKELVRMQRYIQTNGFPESRQQPALMNREDNAAANASVGEKKLGIMAMAVGGKSFVEHIEEFSYLIVPGSDPGGTALMEDRADKTNKPLNEKAMAGHIMSKGHAGKCLYLHPDHQANSYFRYLGREKIKPYAHVIAFSQKPEAKDYLAQFTDRESSTPIRLLVQGFVWIDPDSYQILRMRTNLLQTEVTANLKETITDIRYGKAKFDNSSRNFWLPREINVSWEFPRMMDILVYRNQHKYSDYHLFTVTSDYKIASPKPD